MTINARRRTIIKGMGITIGLAVSGLQRAYANAPAASPSMPPGLDVGVVADARGWALNVSAGTPFSEQARAAFFRKKIKTAATQTALSEDRRAQRVAQIIQRIGAKLPSPRTPPRQAA